MINGAKKVAKRPPCSIWRIVQANYPQFETVQYQNFINDPLLFVWTFLQ